MSIKDIDLYIYLSTTRLFTDEQLNNLIIYNNLELNESLDNLKDDNLELNNNLKDNNLELKNTEIIILDDDNDDLNLNSNNTLNASNNLENQLIIDTNNNENNKLLDKTNLYNNLKDDDLKFKLDKNLNLKNREIIILDDDDLNLNKNLNSNNTFTDLEQQLIIDTNNYDNKPIDKTKLDNLINKMLKYIDDFNVENKIEFDLNLIDNYNKKIKELNDRKSFNDQNKYYTYCITINDKKHYIGKGEFIRIFVHLIECKLAIKHKVKVHNKNILIKDQLENNKNSIKLVIVNKNLIEYDSLYKESLGIDIYLNKEENKNKKRGLKLNSIDLTEEEIKTLKEYQNQQLNLQIEKAELLNDNLKLLIQEAADLVKIKKNSANELTYKEISSAVFDTFYKFKLINDFQLNEEQYEIINQLIDLSFELNLRICSTKLLTLLNREDIRKDNQYLNLKKLQKIIEKFRSFKYEHKNTDIFFWNYDTERYLNTYISNKLKNEIKIFDKNDYKKIQNDLKDNFNFTATIKQIYNKLRIERIKINSINNDENEFTKLTKIKNGIKKDNIHQIRESMIYSIIYFIIHDHEFYSKLESLKNLKEENIETPITDSILNYLKSKNFESNSTILKDKLINLVKDGPRNTNIFTFIDKLLIQLKKEINFDYYNVEIIKQLIGEECFHKINIKSNLTYMDLELNELGTNNLILETKALIFNYFQEKNVDLECFELNCKTTKLKSKIKLNQQYDSLYFKLNRLKDNFKRKESIRLSKIIIVDGVKYLLEKVLFHDGNLGTDHGYYSAFILEGSTWYQIINQNKIKTDIETAIDSSKDGNLLFKYLKDDEQVDKRAYERQIFKLNDNPMNKITITSTSATASTSSSATASTSTSATASTSTSATASTSTKRKNDDNKVDKRKKRWSSDYDEKYRCKYDGCNYLAKDNHLLEIHTRTHTKEKPFACEFCDSRFSSKSLLNRHVKMHSGVRKFVCECGNSFTRKEHLERHQVKCGKEKKIQLNKKKKKN